MSVLLGVGEGDFDRDGSVTNSDLRLLRASIANEETHDVFDLDADGQTTPADEAVWISTVARTCVGDLNLNGRVDFADFLALAHHFNESSDDWEQGDLDGDGVVSEPDFELLAQNFGKIRV